MILRFLKSRGARKFRRDRMAMCGLAVILVYVGIAASIAFGAISEEETTLRFGPNQLVGFLEEPTVEQRLHYMLFWLEQVESPLDRRDPEASLGEVDIAGARPFTTDPDELGERLDEVYELFEPLMEAQEDEAFEEDPANHELLAQLEQAVPSLYTHPDGWRGRWNRFALSMGTDRQGRSIVLRGLYAIKIAVQIGVISALISVAIGTLLGGIAGFYGGVLDHLVVWLYSTFSAIPYIVLLMVLAAMFLGSEFEGTLIPVYVAFCLTFWIGPCRVVRGEVLKLRELEYVQAATAVGFGRFRILWKHVIPNTTHLMFINFSLLFVGAIKAEVILSFLGLGVASGVPSWGRMIDQSKQEVISGFFWQIGAATAFMFVLVLAFNVVSDALQDAFDPKHV